MKIKKNELVKLIQECMVDLMPLNMPGMGMSRVLPMNIEKSEEYENDYEDQGRMLDYGEYKSDSEEGRMIKSDLDFMANAAADLHDMISDSDDLPEWVQGEITTAKDRLASVYDYLIYKLKRMDGDSW